MVTVVPQPLPYNRDLLKVVSDCSFHDHSPLLVYKAAMHHHYGMRGPLLYDDYAGQQVMELEQCRTYHRIYVRLLDMDLHIHQFKQEMVRMYRLHRQGLLDLRSMRDFISDMKHFMFNGLYVPCSAPPALVELFQWAERKCRAASSREWLRKGRDDALQVMSLLQEEALRLACQYEGWTIVVLGRDCDPLYHMLNKIHDRVVYTEITRLVRDNQDNMPVVVEGLHRLPRPILLVDSGFSGTIPRSLSKFGYDFDEVVLLSSETSEYPQGPYFSRTLVEVLEKFPKRYKRASELDSNLRVVSREHIRNDSGVVHRGLYKALCTLEEDLISVETALATYGHLPGYETCSLCGNYLPESFFSGWGVCAVCPAHTALSVEEATEHSGA